MALAECSIDEIAKVPIDRVIATAAAVMRDPAVVAVAGMMPFHPALDDELVTVAPAAAASAGLWSGCDLVLGATRDEMQLFVEPGPMDHDRLVARVARYAGVQPNQAEAMVGAYRDHLRSDGLADDALHIWGAIFSDKEMTLPIRDLLDRAAAHHHNTYGYLFTWSAPDRSDGRPLGAAHGIDIPFTFSTLHTDEWADFVGATDGRSDTANELCDTMHRAWTQFAAHGDPGWPAWSSTRLMQELGETTGVLNDPLGARAALWGTAR